MPAALADPFTILSKMQTLAELNEGLVRQLATAAHIRTLPAGGVLFLESEKHSQLYLVASGTVRLEMLTAKCGRRTILSIGSGEFLAWSALVGDSVMTATAIANDNVQLVCFDAELLRERFEQNNELGFHVMRAVSKALARRLLATRLQLLDLYQT